MELLLFPEEMFFFLIMVHLAICVDHCEEKKKINCRKNIPCICRKKHIFFLSFHKEAMTVQQAIF